MVALSMVVGSKSIIVRMASIGEIVPLRHRILRAGLPMDEARFQFDEVSTTRHVAAFDDSQAICCATFQLNAWENEPAWQLRGMATEEVWQGMGLGKAVLRFATELAMEDSPVRLFWCNARVPALDFYRRQGWVERSEVFDIPTAGPHRKMIRRA